ncbi:MAG: hypothetical protein ACLVE3_09485 [[Clostridium] scindens]
MKSDGDGEIPVLVEGYEEGRRSLRYSRECRWSELLRIICSGPLSRIRWNDRMVELAPRSGGHQAAVVKLDEKSKKDAAVAADCRKRG